MSKPPYRVLQLALRIFSVLLAIGGLCMLFGSRELVVRVFLHPPQAEVSTLLLFLLKEMGGMVLMVSAILFRAGPRSATQYRPRGWIDCGSGHSHGDALAFGLHTGHSANLSGAPRLGAFRCPVGARRLVLLFATGAQWQPAGHF